MNYYNRGGILKVTPECITVDFSSVLWFKSHGQAEEIRKFWHSQGYAESELLPCKFDNGLIVCRNLETFGWAVGTGTLDRRVYELPF